MQLQAEHKRCHYCDLQTVCIQLAFLQLPLQQKTDTKQLSAVLNKRLQAQIKCVPFTESHCHFRRSALTLQLYILELAHLLKSLEWEEF